MNLLNQEIMQRHKRTHDERSKQPCVYCEANACGRDCPHHAEKCLMRTPQEMSAEVKQAISRALQAPRP
jgi:hypothetical protein